jgi:hypothetical protein
LLHMVSHISEKCYRNVITKGSKTITKRVDTSKIKAITN